jgi:hypothetical protein
MVDAAWYNDQATQRLRPALIMQACLASLN